MALGMLRRSRWGRGKGSIAAVTTTGAAASAAGAALLYFLDRRHGAERRERAGKALRHAEEQVESRARELGHRAEEAMRHAKAVAQERGAGLADRARELGQKAGSAAADARARAHEATGSTQQSGVPRQRLAGGAAGAALLFRALVGRGLTRIFAGLLGLSLLTRTIADSERILRLRRWATSAARTAAAWLRTLGVAEGEARGPGGGPAGGPGGGGGQSRRGGRGEVREVKSPAELEAGAASRKPDQGSRDRTDRSGPRVRGRGQSGGFRAAGGRRPEETLLSPPSTEDVGPRVNFDAPPAGSDVHAGELGVLLPHEGDREEEETSFRFAARGKPGAARRADGPEGLSTPVFAAPDAAMAEDNPEDVVRGDDERPGSGSSEPAAPRIAGGEEERRERRAPAAKDATRREPSGDGG
jgi:hypothetical protein